MATRIEKLALHKPNLLRYPDRRSVYWLDELAPMRTNSTTTFRFTPRWSQLCRSKRSYSPHEQFRMSPTWGVSDSALRARPSDRLCALAQPRPHAAGWQPERPLQTNWSKVAQTKGATQRIVQLAQPRRRQGQEGSSHEFKTPKPSSRRPTARSRIDLLATPKHDHPGYTGERPLSWHVPRAVLNAVPTKRVLELACPKERVALYEGYNPYTVSVAARLASPSLRLQELCLPLPRKCIPGQVLRCSLLNLLPGYYHIYMLANTDTGVGVAGPVFNVNIASDGVSRMIIVKYLVLPVLLTSVLLMGFLASHRMLKQKLFQYIPDASKSSLAHWTPNNHLETTRWMPVIENLPKGHDAL